MKQKLVFIFMSVCFIGFSQTNIGVSLGVGISDRYNDANRTETPGISGQNSRIGNLIELRTETSIGKRWFTSGAVSYSTMAFHEKVDVEEMVKSWNTPLELCLIEFPPEGIATVDHKFNFIQIPIMVNYVFANCEECGWKWHVGVGPSFDVNINQKVRTPLRGDNTFKEVNCIERKSVVIGINAEIGTTLRFQNSPNQLRFTLFYSRQLQPLYDHHLNYELGMTGIKASYLFAFNAIK